MDRRVKKRRRRMGRRRGRDRRARVFWGKEGEEGERVGEEGEEGMEEEAGAGEVVVMVGEVGIGALLLVGVIDVVGCAASVTKLYLLPFVVVGGGGGGCMIVASSRIGAWGNKVGGERRVGMMYGWM